MINRPKIVEEVHLKYLDALQKSNVTNMLGAWKYVAAEFKVSDHDATEILRYWIASYGERAHNKT